MMYTLRNEIAKLLVLGIADTLRFPKLLTADFVCIKAYRSYFELSCTVFYCSFLNFDPHDIGTFRAGHLNLAFSMNRFHVV